MALQQMIDKKNTFCLFGGFCPVFYPGQMLSTAPLKIVPSGTKFVKSRQTILICLALVMTESLSK